MNTLTDMLKEKVDYDFTIDKVETIKGIFKIWLKEVAIGKETSETKDMRKILIILVDEP